MTTLGHKLGLYKAMAGAGPLSAHEVASRAGCAERYVREWLNSQAAGGYVDYHPASETYELPAEHALVLADEDSPAFFPPAWEVVASLWFDENKAIDAFQTGKGIPWGDHDGRLFCGVAAFFRPGYTANLTTNWIPALDGAADKLAAGARVADIGCGHGHSTIIMAEAYPNSRFWGFDTHAESVAAARENASRAGVDDRVTFEVADAKSYPNQGYDLICMFDCLHDLGDPVGAARHAAHALEDDGTVMLVEPFAHDRVEDNFNPIGRLYYAASTTLCCAHSLSEEVGLALGAQAGEGRLADVFAKAGFGSFHRATETPFNLVLEARR
jgi:SAM-dependent methyltransferase